MLCYLKYENVSLDLPSKRGLENKGVKERYTQHCICLFIYMNQMLKCMASHPAFTFFISDKAWDSLMYSLFSLTLSATIILPGFIFRTFLYENEKILIFLNTLLKWIIISISISCCKSISF